MGNIDFSTVSIATVLVILGAGMLFSLLLMSVVLPDGIGIWLVRRRNLPKWSLPLAGIGLIAFVVFFLGAIRIDLSYVAPWVWYIGIGVLVLAALPLLGWLLGKFSAIRLPRISFRRSAAAHVVDRQNADLG